jgi:hypothetical protein
MPPGCSVMVNALLFPAALAVSFAAAAVLVFVIVRVSERVDDVASADLLGPAGRSGRTRRFPRRGEPVWWPEFEREFADYVRAGDGPRS